MHAFRQFEVRFSVKRLLPVHAHWDSRTFALIRGESLCSWRRVCVVPQRFI